MAAASTRTHYLCAYCVYLKKNGDAPRCESAEKHFFIIILYFTVLVKVTGHPVMINYSTRIIPIILYRLQTHREHLWLKHNKHKRAVPSVHCQCPFNI